MSAHNTPYHMFQGPLSVPDPANGGSIVIDRYGQLVELVSVGADETRTLIAPSKPGILATLRMKTDAGDIVITAAETWNVTGNTTATFADVGDHVVMISVSATTGYRWDILINVGAALA